MKLSPRPLPAASSLLAAGLLLGACATGTPASAPPGRQPRPTQAPAKAPTTATALTSTPATSAPASTPSSTDAPSDDVSVPATSTAVSSSAAPGADAASTAQTWADDLLGGKSAAACALMDGAAIQQLIGYAQQADPTVRTCGDAALALFQQADMQGTAYAKATAKPTGHDAGRFALTYTEGHAPEQVTLRQQDGGWLVDDYQPASS